MRRAAFIFAAALLLAACSGPGKEAPELLRTVPSRSAEVMYFRHAGPALKLLLDSTHVFRSLDLGRLENTEMVLSYDYAPGRVPLLSLDAGRYRTDSSETVKSILARAEALRLQAAYVVDSVRRNTVLLISPSTAAISEALIHIGSGASVLDAEGFAGALSLAGGREGCILLRNSAAGHFVPRDFGFDDKISRKDIVRFISGACEWTVLNFGSCRHEGIAVDFFPRSDAGYYLTIFKDLEGGESRIGKILPAGAERVVDLPLSDWNAFYEARCRWMDSGAELRIHDSLGKLLEAAFGISPQDWCRRIRPKEVARIVWDGHAVTAVRCSSVPKLPGSDRTAPNPWPGFTSLIFGSVFSEPSGSVCEAIGKWLIIGSPEDVSAFGEADRSGGSTRKHIKYAISRPGYSMVCTDKGAELTVL